MKRQFLSAALAATLLSACGGATQSTTAETDKFSYTVEQFADLQILRYRVPGFESLTLDQKKLVYYVQLVLVKKIFLVYLMRKLVLLDLYQDV